jgi:hypothetical protein
MSDIFPKWTNRLPAMAVLFVLLFGGGAVTGIWYYFSPKYTRVGYQPVQPVPFPHSVHVDQVGLDCRYCHSQVEKSWYSNIPSSSTCLNCHNQILKDDPRLAVVRDSVQSGQPVPWVQIHKVPDYVYFNHCVHCHGEINKMDEVFHAKPLSMTFCLDCHRNPGPNLRPLDKITDLSWKMPDADVQKDQGERLAHDWKVNASQNCSACHR